MISLIFRNTVKIKIQKKNSTLEQEQGYKGFTMG